MYLGIDLGTSGVKVIALDEAGTICGSVSIALDISRPHPHWSEQSPEQWWQATDAAVNALHKELDVSGVKAIGLSGQMHGATLLDHHGDVIRPAILWNDGRSKAQCDQLELLVTDSRERTGNMMMPGFTAPKLKWLQQNEPQSFSVIHKVLLPKDYLRFRMTGEFATDMSDAAGTMWLNIHERNWDAMLLAATGLTQAQMPALYEGPEVTGYLKADLAKRWHMPQVPVVAGAGDNAAGAIGVGMTHPGQAMLSLGTSGVYFAVSHGVVTNPESALHCFCHALPMTWHVMSVSLSAASCLDWVARLTGFTDIGQLIEAIEKLPTNLSTLIFLPYLSGERTPHNNPDAKGVFVGLTHDTTPAVLAQAVLEGVSFALADGLDAVPPSAGEPYEITLIGGGARSRYWRQLLSDVLGKTLTYRAGGEVGPALGAARLAMLGVRPAATLEQCCPVPKLLETHIPNLDRHRSLSAKRQTFNALYSAMKPFF